MRRRSLRMTSLSVHVPRSRKVVVVRRGAVISMGVFLGRQRRSSTARAARSRYGEVPENAVVIPGSRQLEGSAGLSGYAAIIVKARR